MAEDTSREGTDSAEDEKPDVENTEQETPKPAVKEDGSPYTDADIKGLREALSKARKDARATKRQGTTSDDDGAQKNAQDVEKEVSARLEAKYKPVVIKTAARAAFAEAGMKSDRMDKALRLLDLDDLVLKDDGSVDGLDDQIADLKEDFPEFFPRRRTQNIDGGDKSGEGTSRPKTSAEKLTASLLGR
jgi:uncharacterized membrane protein